MTEKANNVEDVNKEDESTFNIERIYLKDLSLEQPNSPEVFTVQEQPKLDISFGVGSNALNQETGYYEVTVQATVQTKLADDKTVFLVEAKQSGIFLLKNIPEDHIAPLLGIRCPQILYPYLRANISHAIDAAGFPPVHLPEISFEQIYQQQQEQQNQTTQ